MAKAGHGHNNQTVRVYGSVYIQVALFTNKIENINKNSNKSRIKVVINNLIPPVLRTKILLFIFCFKLSCMYHWGWVSTWSLYSPPPFWAKMFFFSSLGRCTHFGMELIFFIVSHKLTVLDLQRTRVWICKEHTIFSCCWAIFIQNLGQFSFLCCPISVELRAQGARRGTARTTDPNWTKRYSIPLGVMLMYR